MKRVALASLWAALSAEVFWICLEHLRSQVRVAKFGYPLFVAAIFLLLAVTRGRMRWIVGVLRMFIGLAFASAVCDRLGLLGGPGAPGVSWGNFTRFTAYTGQVNSFLPHAIIPALAVVETVVEGSLGLAMLAGFQTRLTSAASAALLTMFGLAMTVSLGASSQFWFAVFVLAAGAWVLACVDASWISADGLVSRRQRRATAIA
jgi:hypothetical protein